MLLFMLLLAVFFVQKNTANNSMNSNIQADDEKYVAEYTQSSCTALHSQH